MTHTRRDAQRDKLKEDGAKALALLQAGQTTTQAAAALGCSRTRLYRALYALYPAGDWPIRPDPLLG